VSYEINSFGAVYGVMATFPARRSRLNAQLSAITGQVDLLYVVLNEYESVPAVCEQYKNVITILPERDQKDVGKFIVTFDDPNAVIFLFDDDLAYPADYVVKTIQRVTLFEQRSLNDRAIYGYHGTSYDTLLGFLVFGLSHLVNPLSMYHTINDARKSSDPAVFPSVYCYWRRLSYYRVVHQLGTGTVCMRSKYMPRLADMNSAQKMVDVRLARLALESGMRMVCLPRNKNWLPKGQDLGESIYTSFTKRPPHYLTDEIIKLAYGHRKKALLPEGASNTIDPFRRQHDI
jgi:hypothetical protein